MGRERLAAKLNHIRKGKGKALVSYLLAGYPDKETSLLAFRKVLEGGTDILEVGFPFSDPVADGQAIQEAHYVALKNGTKSKDVFETTSKLREDFRDIPFLLMTYYNPMFRMGLERFCKLSKESGIDGFIVPDLPAEEARELKVYTEKYDLALVMLASPTSNEKRLNLICRTTDCMTYFISITGTTGARDSLPIGRLRKNVEKYKKNCEKPVVVGFGISTGEQASQIAEFSDGIVVGSALVGLAKEGKLEKLLSKVAELKSSLKSCKNLDK
ncbi:MAG: tryptophan synthase subunit alpha [Aquificaceae bacterium]